MHSFPRISILMAEPQRLKIEKTTASCKKSILCLLGYEVRPGSVQLMYKASSADGAVSMVCRISTECRGMSDSDGMERKIDGYCLCSSRADTLIPAHMTDRRRSFVGSFVHDTWSIPRLLRSILSSIDSRVNVCKYGYIVLGPGPAGAEELWSNVSAMLPYNDILKFRVAGCLRVSQSVPQEHGR